MSLGTSTAHSFSLKTSDTNRLTIDSSGNAGINVTPSTALHIKQPSNDRAGGLYLEIDGNDYGLSAFVNSGGYGVIGSNGTFTTDILTLNLNNGNVGIGESNPLSKVHIEDTTGATLTLGNSQSPNDVVSGTVFGRMNFYASDRSSPTSNVTGGVARIEAISTATYSGTSPSALLFYTHDNTANDGTVLGNPTERMRIDSSGNVGIGTDSPASTLTVHDDASANSTTLVLANSFSTDTAGDSSALMFQLKRSYASGVNDAGFIKSIKEEAWDATGDRNSALTFGTRAGASEPTERLRIDSSGNVGIGSTSPAGKLDVNTNTATNIKAFASTNDQTTNFAVTNFASGNFRWCDMEINHRDGSSVDTTPIILAPRNKDIKVQSQTAHNIIFGTDGSERMRIDSSGNVLVGATSNTGSGATSGKQVVQFDGATGNGIYVDDTRTASGTDNAIVFGRGVQQLSGKLKQQLLQHPTSLHLTTD